jgi:pyruvate formate lyase activating enzyme
MKCDICFHHCELQENKTGFCHVRTIKNGVNVASNYGLLTALALDPIEKKPLREFYPGSFILSCGSYGCNLRCPFCQNYDISQCDLSKECRYFSPEVLVDEAIELKPQGNIGIAFTYNEPLMGYEYVRDTAKLAQEKGLKTVLVTNGCASIRVLEEILPYINAMNIDLKGFSEGYFHYVGGDFAMTKDFISLASRHCHVELTTLVIPHHNDDPKMMEEEARWIAVLDSTIPLHLTRYFPHYKEDEPATPIATLEKLSAIAKRYLKSVYLGNI